MLLPKEFIETTRQTMGEGLFRRLAQALDEEPVSSVRINPLKCYHMPCDSNGTVEWCNTGYYLNSRPQFTFDPLLHAGHYYVQEASSMFIHHVLRSHVKEPAVVLDLCAAPGGKSTCARTILPRGSALIANEPVRQRAQVLAENMQKFGHRDVIVTNNYPRDFQQTGLLFDVVIADVPCSGEGMFRKDAQAVSDWSPQKVEQCAQLQREIVSDIWGNLKPGGLLIYSTCTYNTQENEENVRWIMRHLDAELLPVFTEVEWQLLSSFVIDFSEPVYRFVPGLVKGEGLFMAVLRKGWGHDNTIRFSPTAYKPSPALYAPLCEAWIDGDFDIRQDGDQMTAIPVALQPLYTAATSRLKVLHAGIPIGTVKKYDIIPNQALAFTAAFNKHAFPQAELGYADAIRYLRGESLTLPADTERGFVLVTYKEAPLGFVKHIGSRANNLYPDHWRIRSTHVPTDEVHVLDVK